MILYNVTCSVDDNVHEEWYDWMRETHIPDVMKTGMFLECRICRISGEEQGGKAFAVQYLCESEEKYAEYQRKYALALQAEHANRYGKNVAAFRTKLEVLYQSRRKDFIFPENNN